MDNDLLVILSSTLSKNERNKIEIVNQKTLAFGLQLSQNEISELILARNASLKKYQRVELNDGILDKLIYTFCDSPYIDSNNYAMTLYELEDLFYAFKNECNDQISDDELFTFMREQFDEICYGDINYLRDTCLTRFSEAIRKGYKDFIKNQGENEDANLSQETRWDPDLYQSILKDLFW